MTDPKAWKLTGCGQEGETLNIIFQVMPRRLRLAVVGEGSTGIPRWKGKR